MTGVRDSSVSETAINFAAGEERTSLLDAGSGTTHLIMLYKLVAIGIHMYTYIYMYIYTKHMK